MKQKRHFVKIATVRASPNIPSQPVKRVKSAPLRELKMLYRLTFSAEVPRLRLVARTSHTASPRWKRRVRFGAFDRGAPVVLIFTYRQSFRLWQGSRLASGQVAVALQGARNGVNICAHICFGSVLTTVLQKDTSE